MSNDIFNNVHVCLICSCSCIVLFLRSQDPEIDRLYSTSPPESEQVGTFELDNSLMNEFQEVRKRAVFAFDHCRYPFTQLSQFFDYFCCIGGLTLLLNPTD